MDATVVGYRSATVKPVAFTTRSDGSIAVEVDQVANGLDGTLLSALRSPEAVN